MINLEVVRVLEEYFYYLWGSVGGVVLSLRGIANWIWKKILQLCLLTLALWRVLHRKGLLRSRTMEGSYGEEIRSPCNSSTGYVTRIERFSCVWALCCSLSYTEKQPW